MTDILERLRTWRQKMPAVWHGNADLDAAIKEIESLRVGAQKPGASDVWSAQKHDEIIKRLMSSVGMPNSTSLYTAFKQFANELHALANPSTAKTGGAGREPGFVKPDNERQVFFYEQDFYVLSNFSAFNVMWRGIRFQTSEHAYHFERFWKATPAVPAEMARDFICNTTSAHEAFRYAQDNKGCQRKDWDDVKVDAMREILRAKVDQHEYVRRKLLASGDRELIEDSWRDSFWGWGLNRNGQNMLGKLWMEVRAELRASALISTEGRSPAAPRYIWRADFSAPPANLREILVTKMLATDQDALPFADYGPETQQRYLRMADAVIEAIQRGEYRELPPLDDSRRTHAQTSKNRVRP